MGHELANRIEMAPEAQKDVGEMTAAKAGGLGKGSLPSACSASGILRTGQICLPAALLSLASRPGCLRASALHEGKSAPAISTIFMSL
jgi:hypothetical protein